MKRSRKTAEASCLLCVLVLTAGSARAGNLTGDGRNPGDTASNATTSDRTAPQFRTVYRSTSDPNSVAGSGRNLISVDVFWCTDRMVPNSNLEVIATQYASSLATLLKIEKGPAFQSVGEIRTRPISREEFSWRIDLGSLPANTSDLALSPLLTYDDTNETLKLIGDKWKYFGIGPLVNVKISDSNITPNYMAAYICDNASRDTTTSGTVYFQVKDQQQTNYASTVAGALQDSLPEVRVNRKIEVMGDKSPEKSQLRYFYPDDADAAGKIAAQVNSAAQRATGVQSFPAYELQLKKIPGYEGKVRPKTFEIWISK